MLLKIICVVLVVVTVAAYQEYEDVSYDADGNYEEDNELFSSVRHKGYETPTIKTLSPQEVQEVRGAIKEILSGRKIENPFTPLPLANQDLIERRSLKRAIVKSNKVGPLYSNVLRDKMKAKIDNIDDNRLESQTMTNVFFTTNDILPKTFDTPTEGYQTDANNDIIGATINTYPKRSSWHDLYNPRLLRTDKSLRNTEETTLQSEPQATPFQGGVNPTTKPPDVTVEEPPAVEVPEGDVDAKKPAEGPEEPTPEGGVYEEPAPEGGISEEPGADQTPSEGGEGGEPGVDETPPVGADENSPEAGGAEDTETEQPRPGNTDKSTPSGGSVVGASEETEEPDGGEEAGESGGATSEKEEGPVDGTTELAPSYTGTYATAAESTTFRASTSEPTVTTALITTTSEPTTTMTTTTTTKRTPRRSLSKFQLDVPALLEIIANLTYDYEMNLTDNLNETLIKLSIPTCPTPTTTLEPRGGFDYDANATGIVIAKCFVCGLEVEAIPRNAHCGDAFAGDFLPLVPVDMTARGHVSSYRKYCRYMDVNHYVVNASQPRSVYGRWTGGCAVRWIDLSGIYTQRTCRNKERAVLGKHYASKRMAKLEMALGNVDNGCIVSPMATLVPFSRGISLYARFYACVCMGSWCNIAPPHAPWFGSVLIPLLAGMVSPYLLFS